MESAAPEVTLPTPADFRPLRPLYVPTWWEKRFPWLLDLICSLDPDPLAARLTPLFVPIRTAIEILCQPLDIALEAVGRWTRWVWARSMRALARGIQALPLPGLVQRWLWLQPVRLRDAHHDSAQMALKRQHAVVLPLSLMAAVLAHVGVFVLSPTMEAGAFPVAADELVTIFIPPEIEIPPPPQQIARPATPVMASADIDEDITIAPTRFDDNPVPDLPRPPVDVVTDISAAPVFTPFTVAPQIQNRSEVQAAMVQEYPRMLRDAGIGGTVRVYFFVDENGQVQDTRIDQSSGHQALDDAAIAVAGVYRFSAALNRDQPVPVWVSFPITFQVR